MTERAPHVPTGPVPISHTPTGIAPTGPGAIVGVLLAGGLASRMGGGDKGLRTLGGIPILERVIARVRPQVGRLILNANGDPARFQAFPFLADLPVVPDPVEGHAGPLAGILAALDWVAATGAAGEGAAGEGAGDGPAGEEAAPETAPVPTHVLSLPTDCPFLPRDLAARMAAAMRGQGSGPGSGPGAVLASVRSGSDAEGWQTHPVIGLWPVSLRHDLRHALVVEGLRKIDRWTARYPLAHADYGTTPVDPFFNANTPEDLAEADRLLSAHPEL